MHTFKAAQPALLYLSPACILSVLLTGLVKGQLNAVFEYSSKENEKKKDDYTRSDNAKKSKDGDKKKKKKKNPKPSPVVKTESSSEGREEDAKDDDRKKKNKKTSKPSPVAKTESSSEEDAKLKPSDNGDGPGAVTGEEDYVEVTSARNRKSKRAQRKIRNA